MLKRISPAKVELGMFVHNLEGSWFSHPFWKSRFLLNDAGDLATLRESALDAVVIDLRRGRDVTEACEEAPAKTEVSPRIGLHGRPQPPSPPRPQPARPASIKSAAFSSKRGTSGPVPFTREFGNAKLVHGKARKVISRVFLQARLGNVPGIAEVEPVVEDIYASIQRNPYAFSSLMRCKQDQEIAYRHALSVSAMMISLARQMKLSPSDTREAGMAGLLMDVGVARLDVDLQQHEGRYDSVDRDLWDRHTYLGHDLLRASDAISETVMRVALNHHEAMDGSGFPKGLVGNEIDLFSRMAAICNAYDHYLCGAIDGVGLDPASAIERMQAQSARFDTAILERFVETLGVYPVGSFVTLRSGRLAMVVDQDPTAPHLPTVRAFYSLERGRHVGAETIALSSCFGADAIVGVADLEGLDLPSPGKLRESLMSAALRSVG
ncbi:phosphohydrolase [Novosphingobium sp. PC22D]|uniref:HD-GYP domain-containing protein n=1 Tax=Novosphingobium sp. PC22D TaxID=1962403 RepID=UPI000BFB0372|nr:HD-GYP domain-containing protein [Novosphingobium sp. PC22D]PEQ12621.1 phosphohydrolase [Novosphingobium sp. PC22D]